MSRSNPGRATQRRGVISCRIGWHHWGAERNVGGGILRRVCSSCGMVTIDLRQVDAPSDALVSSWYPPRLGSDH